MAAVEGGIGEPPGLARQRRPRRLRRSVAATGDMDGDGGGGGGGGSRYVLALPAMASLAVLIAHLDATVPRRPRSYLPRAVPMGWWAFRLPVFPCLPPPPPPPPPAKNPVKEEEARVVVVVAPPVDPSDEAGKRVPKRARRCLNCDAVETPQWSSGPMGKSTLCNACGVRLRAVGSLPEHRLAARTTATEPPPSAASPPDSPIWTPGYKPSSSPDIYLVRRTPKLPVTRPPRVKQPLLTAPARVPPAAPKTKTKTKTKAKAKKQKRKRSCVHCGSTETPQWREGPMGRGTLCNACGVRYRQGRLLPEYRPKGSPTFSPSVHAANHRQVLELRRQQRHNTNRSPPPPPPMSSTVDSAAAAKSIPDEQKPVDLPAQEEVVNVAVATTAATTGGGGAASSLDALLFDGPSAPLIVDGDDFLVS